jgi:hypothetical protein
MRNLSASSLAAIASLLIIVGATKVRAQGPYGYYSISSPDSPLTVTEGDSSITARVFRNGGMGVNDTVHIYLIVPDGKTAGLTYNSAFIPYTWSYVDVGNLITWPDGVDEDYDIVIVLDDRPEYVVVNPISITVHVLDGDD